MTVQTSTVLKSYFEKNDFPTEAQFIDLIDTIFNKPKIYRALLTQTGTSAPTAIVLENTLEATITYSYQTAGLYRITADSAVFTTNKTMVFLGNNLSYFAANIILNVQYINTTTIDFSSKNIITSTLTDDVYSNIPIEIIVYP